MNVLATSSPNRRQQISPKKEENIDVKQYEKNFIAYKYAYQLSIKRKRLLTALDYYARIPEAQFIKIEVRSKDFCFDKNLKLYLRGIDVRKSFIENYQDIFNQKYVSLDTVLTLIQKKIMQLFDELTKNFDERFQINTIESYLKQNNEKNGQWCQNKAEECRKQMLQQIPFQDSPEDIGFIDSEQYFSTCKTYFTTIPIQQQNEILNSFFHYFTNINQGGKYQGYNFGLKGLCYTSQQNQKTVYINQSQFDNTIYIPVFILDKLKEYGIQGLVLQQMIDLKITILNTEGQQRLMQKFR